MNPFEKNTHNNYVSFVEKQIREMKVGESAIADLGGKTLAAFRMTLRYAAQKIGGVKFKTKKALDGSLWIKRVN
jgi:hypothetical protein